MLFVRINFFIASWAVALRFLPRRSGSIAIHHRRQLTTSCDLDKLNRDAANAIRQYLNTHPSTLTKESHEFLEGVADELIVAGPRSKEELSVLVGSLSRTVVWNFKEIAILRNQPDVLSYRLSALEKKFEIQGKKFEIREKKFEIREKKFEIRERKFEIQEKKFEIQESIWSIGQGALDLEERIRMNLFLGKKPKGYKKLTLHALKTGPTFLEASESEEIVARWNDLRHTIGWEDEDFEHHESVKDIRGAQAHQPFVLKKAEKGLIHLREDIQISAKRVIELLKITENI